MEEKKWFFCTRVYISDSHKCEEGMLVDGSLLIIITAC